MTTITAMQTRSYLPLNSMRSHTTIKGVASRTALTQTFSNDSDRHLENIIYSFPLYDGVSVVSFKATIGHVEIRGVVKEKQQARRDYTEAVSKGSAAGLLEQLPEASDIFVNRIGNVPAKAKVTVDIEYIGELKHDAEANGVRFTIPSSIAPRYGTRPQELVASSTLKIDAAGAIQVTVDYQGPDGCPIQQIQSPSHPVTVTVGRTTAMPADDYLPNCGSATLSLDSTSLDKDFVFIATIRDADKPKALLETHPSLEGQRALMVTLVPRFNLVPSSYGEIVFVVDRSGSMAQKIGMVTSAMTIMLKSLPVGVKFNICSFGSQYSFLWPKSKPYNDESLSEAIRHVDGFRADYGGTEILSAVEAAIARRYTDMLLDVMVLTDGEVYDQSAVFHAVRKASNDHECRFFSLGIGSRVSTALVEGIAAAGNGLSQFVAEGEKMNAKMVRLLKAALSPHISNYSLEVKYRQEALEDDEFELVESIEEASKNIAAKPTISLFEENIDTGSQTTPTSDRGDADRFAHLPIIPPPSILQAPYRIPPLYNYSRSMVYLLLDPDVNHKIPEAVILRATCDQGPLALEIKVEDVGKGETIHQLAAKKAVYELEKYGEDGGGGWLSAARDRKDNELLRDKYAGRWDEIVEREAVRLGVKFQIAGRWCSFLAIDGETPARSHTESSDRASRRGAGADNASGGLRSSRNFLASGSSSTFGASNVSINAPPQAPQLTRLAPPIPSVPEELMIQYRREMENAASMPFPGDSDDDDLIADLAEDTHHTMPPPAPRRIARSCAPAHAPAPVSYPSHLPGIRDEPPKLTDEATMQALIRLQNSDGSWNWAPELISVLNLNTRGQLPPQDVSATAFCIAFLRKFFPQDVESWELLVDKAKAWLTEQRRRGGETNADAEVEIKHALSYVDLM
ncbi:von Willebrand factor type A domain-containing protein [Xylariaceae sp. FL0594]|nr:von Willebrand factor type A domain-containing protein [Xylariaceae sp. FL0594]